MIRLRLKLPMWVRGDYLGTTPEFHCTSLKDLDRADSINDERTVLDWLLSPVDERTVFWDIGAYHGHYTTVAALLGAQVMAFEPVDANRTRLRKNIERNGLGGSVDIHPVALSDANSTRRFSPDTSVSSIGPTGRKTIEAKRGDAFSPHPDVVKIDVEGHENAVLEGMEDALLTVDRIAIEIHETGDLDDAATKLREAGLTVTEVETDRSEDYVGGYRSGE